MPLSKKRMRERKKQDRSSVKPKLTIAGLQMEGNRILSVKPKSNLNTQLDVKPNLPIYNPHIHRPGDRVLFKVGKKLVETTVPELDGGGQPIQEYW